VPRDVKVITLSLFRARVCVFVCVRARARKWSLVGAFFTRLIFEELEEEFVFKKDRCSHTKNESIDCFETTGARRVSSFQTGKGCTFSRFKKVYRNI
jgi:hypothetical protein